MAKVKKSALANKFGSALANHANDETDYGTQFGNLPPGIGSGVAKLVEAKIGQYKKGKNEGESFLYLAGVIVSPKSHTFAPRVFANGKIQSLPPETVITAGMRTSLMVPLCDTTKKDKDGSEVTVDTDENVATALNELRKLGADTSSVDGEEAFVALLEAIVEEGPFFKFSTSGSDPNKDYPTPRTWENWHGSKGLEDYAVEDADDDVTEAEEEEEAEEIPDVEEEAEEAEEEAEDTDGPDNAQLAIAADRWEKKKRKGPGKDAADELTKRAKGCGLDPAEYDSWAAVVEAIEGGNGEPVEDDEEEEAEEAEEEAEEEEEAEPVEPSKGDVGMFRPKGAKKDIEVEVTKVVKKTQACDLKRLDDGKVYKDIPWDRVTF
jgi:hypothetical protein